MHTQTNTQNYKQVYVHHYRHETLTYSVQRNKRCHWTTRSIILEVASCGICEHNVLNDIKITK